MRTMLGERFRGGKRVENSSGKSSSVNGSHSKTPMDMGIVRLIFLLLNLIWSLSLSVSLLILIGHGRS